MKRITIRKDEKPSAKINFIYNSIYQIVAIIIPLVTTPYLSRRLGPNGLGQYSLEMAVASYFIMFIKLGLNNYGGRQIAYARDSRERLSHEFWEMYVFQFIMMCICTLVYLFYCLFVSTHKTISIILMMYVLSSGIDVTWFFWGLEEFKLTVKRDFIIKILSTLGIFIFVKSSSDTWKYTLLLSSAFFLSQAFLWPSVKKHVDFIIPSKEGVIKHIKPNLVLFIPTIAISIYNIMDRIMLGTMSNTVEVGLYQSSESIIQIPMALITSLGTVMQPRMANMISRKVDKKSIKNVFAASIALVMFLSTSIGFGIMSVSRQFVPLFFGKGFEKCIILFQILLPCCFFLAFANVIRTQYLIPQKKDKEYIISLFAGAGVNVIANYILISRIQSIGASIGTLLAEIVVCLVQAYLMKDELDSLHHFIQIIPFVISGLIMYVIWEPINMSFLHSSVLPLFAKIIGGGITYLLALFVSLCLWDRLIGLDVDYKMMITSMMSRFKINN